MASPLDAALIATQAYKLRPATPSGARPKPASQAGAPARTGAPLAGRREAPAVSLSLSSEALAILSGGDRRTAPTPRDPYRSDAAPAQARGDDLFEPLDDPHRFAREAPFAHLKTAANTRPMPPGSRLDISV
jgi:hypothetical protein